MSTYATISGNLTYKRAADFRRAVAMLAKGGRLVDRYVVDQCKHRISDDPDVNAKRRTIRIPLGLHRNLVRALDELFRGATGKIIWTSTDGMFCGGIFVDGKETTHDLTEWARANGHGQAPNPQRDFDGFCQWQSDVEDHFFEHFA